MGLRVVTAVIKCAVEFDAKRHPKSSSLTPRARCKNAPASMAAASIPRRSPGQSLSAHLSVGLAPRQPASNRPRKMRSSMLTSPLALLITSVCSRRRCRQKRSRQAGGSFAPKEIFLPTQTGTFWEVNQTTVTWAPHARPLECRRRSPHGMERGLPSGAWAGLAHRACASRPATPRPHI